MNHIDLDTITLDTGAHDSPDDGACLLEVVALFAHEPFTDRPACVSPVLAAFGRSWNDALDHDARQTLKQYIPRLVGTAGRSDLDERAAWMATDWIVRVHAPTWLRLAGLAGQAERLESLPELRAGMDTPSIMGPLSAAADAAWDAARAAARDAAGAAAGAALAPTRDQLITSAHDLFDRMISLYERDPAVSS